MSRLDSIGVRVLKVVKRYSKAYSFKRYPAGSFLKGRWFTQTPSTVSINAHIQPLTGKEKEEVPEGRREKNAIRIYTESVLNGIDTNYKIQPDQVVYKNVNYEVYNIKNWIDSYYKALALEVER